MGLGADRKHSSKLQASLEPFPWLWLLPAHHSLGEQKITSFHFVRGVKLSPPPHLSPDSSGCDLRIQGFFFFLLAFSSPPTPQPRLFPVMNKFLFFTWRGFQQRPFQKVLPETLRQTPRTSAVQKCSVPYLTKPCQCKQARAVDIPWQG